MRFWLSLPVLLTWLTQVGSVHADESKRSTAPAGEASLGGLFGGKRATLDPALVELEAMWAELAAHPLAQTAGKVGLDRARVELTRLHALIGEKADANAIQRRKQRVWAALSLSDREIARAELAAALRTALVRREQAEAALKAAQKDAPARPETAK